MSTKLYSSVRLLLLPVVKEDLLINLFVDFGVVRSVVVSDCSSVLTLVECLLSEN